MGSPGGYWCYEFFHHTMPWYCNAPKMLFKRDNSLCNSTSKNFFFARRMVLMASEGKKYLSDNRENRLASAFACPHGHLPIIVNRNYVFNLELRQCTTVWNRFLLHFYFIFEKQIIERLRWSGRSWSIITVLMTGIYLYIVLTSFLNKDKCDSWQLISWQLVKIMKRWVIFLSTVFL